MDLLDQITAHLPFTSKVPPAQYFFALNIGLSYVTAAVWEVVAAKVDIIGTSTLSYQDSEDLFKKANLALDKALGAFEIEPQQILFGIPDSWLMDDDLKEPYLKLLRRMVKEYGLKPMAYVATTQALAHFLQKQEGIPPTAILIGVDEHVVVSVLRGGKAVETKEVKRSGDIFQDVEKSLLGFSDVEVLPSKLLLHSATEDQEKLEKIKGDLTGGSWMQRLSFLHLPKIELLPEKIAIEAVILAGAVEVSPDVNLKQSFTNSTRVSLISTDKRGDLMEAETDVSTQKGAKEDDKVLGFVRGDIAQKVETAFGQESLEEDSLPTVGGVVSNEVASSQESYLDDEQLEEAKGLLGKVRLYFKRLKSVSFKYHPIDRFGGSRLIVALGVLVAVVLAYLFLSQAEVKIFVEPKILTKDTEIIADPKATLVEENRKIIPGSVVETTVSGSSKAAATGTKKIGDSAKGQVVLYNKTDSSKTFTQGTILTGPNGLKFSLDAQVVVASQSAVEGGIAFGKTVGSATASEIGPESNLPAGTQLQIGNLSAASFSAKVDSAFSGGTAKDITVVTADDQKKLQAQVTDELKHKAAQELQEKNPNKKVIPDALSVADAKFNFSKKVNDQAVEFSLSATIRFKGTAYSDSDLKTIISKLVETNVPEGFELNLAETETQADVSKIDKDGRLVFLARFKAKLLPKLNSVDLKRSIRGKSAAEVANILKNIENVLGSEIKLSPNLPPPLSRMPLLDQNIHIIITPK